MSRALPVSRIQLAIVLAVLATVGVAGAVWACTPKPQNFALDPPAAAAGHDPPAQVTATGQTTPDTEVTVHWNGVDGPLLAETTADPAHQGQFSATFEVPESAEPGVAYVVATAGDGADQGVARAVLELTGDGQPATTAPTSAWQASADAATADPAEAGAAGMATPTVAGLGMLALGGAGLFASFTTVAVQRRRVPAHRPG